MTTPIATLANSQNVEALLANWPTPDTTDERFICVLALNPESFVRRFSLYVEAAVNDEQQAEELLQSVID